MKLILQTKLFFKEGTSDKVYEIDLCEVGQDAFVVNFRYGRRGANLKDGTKTVSPVDRKKAEEIFEALAAEKRKGGYQSETEMFQVLPVLTNTAPNTLEGSLLQRLQNAIDNKNTFKTEWATSRVAWRVGEIRLTEAVPYLIKLIEKGDGLQRYAILWALARCADKRAIPTFEAYANNGKYSTHIRKVANEGLLLTLEGAEKSKLQAKLLEKLPQEMQEYIAVGNTQKLQNCIAERLAEQQTAYFFLEDLYLLAATYNFLPRILAQVLAALPLTPPYFRHIRSIYKLAELRDDAQILGILSYTFEKGQKMYESPYFNTDSEEEDIWIFKKHVAALDQVINVKKEVKKKDSRIAFSDRTKAYFQLRLLRNLQKMGKQNGNLYVKLATATLLQYKQDDFTPAYTKAVGYGSWVNLERKYRHNIIALPPCSKATLLNQILLGSSPDFKLNKQTFEWQSAETRQVLTNNYYYQENEISQEVGQGRGENTLTNVVTNWVKNLFGSSKKTSSQTEKAAENSQTEAQKPARNEMYPEHWDKMPQAYIQLLLQAKLDLIHEFAYNNLRQHPDIEDIESKITDEMVANLLSSAYQIPAFFGLGIAKKRFANHADKDFVLLLLNAKHEDARKLAREIVEKYPSNFVQETDFVTKLLFNDYKEVRTWTRILLANVYFSEDMQKVIVGKTVIELLALRENTPENNEKVADITINLLLIAKEVLQNVAWKIIEELLASVLEQNKVLASEILVLKLNKITAEDVPVALLNSFLSSSIEDLQRNGMNIITRYAESTLFERADLLAEMAISSALPVRSEALAICKRLAPKNVNFSENIIQLFAKSLIKKENFEGSHELLANLLLQEFEPYLAKISLKTTLNLLYCHYRQGQFVGFHILKTYINTQEMSIRQVVALGNHELLPVRHWCLGFYEKNVARLRYEREDALRLLDAKWDDTRQAAKQFFSTHFREEDWDIDSLVSVADSIRPDIETYGKELITKFFQAEQGEVYLEKLSQHPSVNMQLFVSNYLSRFAVDNLVRLQSLDFYFRSVLTRVNKARVVKERVLDFLEQEALKTADSAQFICLIINDMVATSAVQDKARYIGMLQKISAKFPHLEVAMERENLEVSI